jgi:hypothetical protein
MLFYIDTDFISKIISLELIDEFLYAYSIDKNNLRIIQNEKNKIIYLIDKKYQHLSADKKKKNKKFVNSIKALFNPNLPIDLLDALHGIQNIDHGEKVLLQYLYVDKNSFLLTADRRFLNALKNIMDHVTFVKNRVLIFEQALIKIVEIKEFNNIKVKLVNGKKCDSYLNNILSNRQISEDKFIELLQNRCDDFKDILYVEN